ncbi:MAG: hypothetical protein WD063_01205 [Pirellulales bacterium]
MRSILTVGSLAFACLWFGFAADAADNFDNYYAKDYVAEDHADGPPGEEPLPGDSCGCCDSTACDCCCECECFDGCDCSSDRRRILGMLPSDHCFDGFISPLSNPFFFEDPRSLTEVRGIFLDNSLPSDISGGDVHVWAAQLRGRVTDRASIIAPRVSYLQVNQAAGGPPRGFLSAPVGFKYNFIRDVERQLLVSAGMTYFIKGSSDAFSNFGDGDFHFFLTGGKEVFGRGHWLSATGFRIPLDSNWGTQLWYWSNQWDYELANHIYPLVGINWFHWMRSAGNNLTGGITSIDLINLPSGGVAGTDVVSGVVGVKWKPTCHCELGTGFEFPLTDRTDILRNRVYADLIFRY